MKQVGELAVVAQEDVRQDLQAMFRGAIRASLEVFLEQELEELVGAEWYARVGGRRDRRNGSYRRRLLTSLGQIDVGVPRSRESGSTGEVLGRYQRRTAEIDDLLATAYVNGVSHRKAGELTAAGVSLRHSSSSVHRMARTTWSQTEVKQRGDTNVTIRIYQLLLQC